MVLITNALGGFMSLQTIYIQDIAIYSAVGASPMAVYAAVEANILGGSAQQHSVTSWSESVTSTRYYEHLLRQTLWPLLVEYDVPQLYLQACNAVYQLALAMFPEYALKIIHTEIDLTAVQLPCIVVAIDSVENNAQQSIGEIAVAMLLSNSADSAIATLELLPLIKATQCDAFVFSVKPVNKPEQQLAPHQQNDHIVTPLTYIYPALDFLGDVSQLMAVIYALGHLQFEVQQRKQIHDVTQEKVIEQCNNVI